MADIIIHKDEKLKLDYLLQKLKENNTSKNIKIDDGQGVLDYTKTESVIYNPQGETGTTTIKINNQKIEIQVTDIPDEGLQHHWVVKEGDDSTVIEDIVNGADFELNEEYTWNPSSGVGDLWIDESGSVVNSTDDRVQLGDSATQIIPIAPSGHDNSTSSGIGRFGHWEEDNRIYWDYADGGFGFGIASSETAFTGVGSDELDLMRTVALRGIAEMQMFLLMVNT